MSGGGLGDLFNLQGIAGIPISIVWFIFSVRLIKKLRSRDRDGVLKLIRVACIVYCGIRIIEAIAAIVIIGE